MGLAIKENHWFFRLPGIRGNFCAITTPWAIYMCDNLRDPYRILEEMVHYVQMKDVGRARYVCMYCASFLKKYLFQQRTRFRWMDSYQSLYWEVEAKAIANKVLEENSQEEDQNIRRIRETRLACGGSYCERVALANVRSYRTKLRQEKANT